MKRIISLLLALMLMLSLAVPAISAESGEQADVNASVGAASRSGATPDELIPGGFYLLGTFNNWKADEDYLMTYDHEDDDGNDVYELDRVVVRESDRFRVASSDEHGVIVRWYLDNAKYVYDNGVYRAEFCDDGEDGVLNMYYIGSIPSTPDEPATGDEPTEPYPTEPSTWDEPTQPSTADELPVIHVGETKTATIYRKGAKAYFCFVPEEDMNIVFYSSANNDTYGYMYNSSWYQIMSNDDGGEGGNFRISYNVKAGRTYYFGAGYYGGYSTGSYSVTLERFDYTEIEPGVAVTVDINEPGEMVYLHCVPDDNIIMNFTSSSTQSVCAYLYSSGMYLQTSVNTEGNDTDFSFRYPGYCDEPYFLGVRFCDSDATGSFTVTLEPTYYPTADDIESVEFRAVRPLYAGMDEDPRLALEAVVTFDGFEPFTYDYAYTPNYDNDQIFGGYEYSVYNRLNDLLYYGFSVNTEADTDVPGTYTAEVTLSDDYDHGFTYNSEVEFDTVADPVDHIEVIGSPVVVDGEQYSYYYTRVYNEEEGRWEEIEHKVYHNIIPDDVVVYYSDNSTSHLRGYGAWSRSFHNGTFTYDVYGADEAYRASSINTRNRFYFITDQYENEWQRGGSYTVTARHCGREADYTVNVTLCSTISIGEEKYLNINSPGEYYYLMFCPTEDTRVTAKVYTYSDMSFCLTDEDMNILVEADYNEDRGYYSFSYDVVAGNTYFIGARHNDESDYGSVWVYLDSVSTIPINVGDTLTATVTANRWYYSFTPEDDMFINFYSTSSWDTYAYIYDENFNQLAYNDDGGSGNNFSLRYAVQAGKTYYFYVRFYDSENIGTFDVTLTGEQMNTLTLGERTTAYVGSTGATGYYSFTPEEDMTVCFRTFSEAEGYLTGYIYNDRMNDISVQSSYNPRITYDLVGGRTYYFLVRSDDLVDFSLDIMLEQIHIEDISLGDTVTVDIEERGQFAYYRFVPSTDVMVVYRSPGVQNDEVYGAICGSDFYPDYASSGRSFNLRGKLYAGNTYYLCASLLYGTGSFTVSLDRFRYTDIGLDQTVTAEIDQPGIERIYRFIPTEDMTVNVYGTGWSSAYAVVYNSYFEYINDYSGSAINMQCEMEAGETYYIVAKGYNNSVTGSFDLVIKRQGITEIHLGDVMTADLEMPGERAIYEFTPDEDMTVIFRIESQYYTSAYLQDMYTYNSYGNSGYRFTIKRELKAGRTYRLTTYNYYYDETGVITTSLWQCVYNDINIGYSAVAEITQPGDCVYYRFVPEEDTLVNFRVNSDYYTYSRIYDSNLSSLTSSSGNFYTLSYNCEAGKTYYASVNYSDIDATGSINVSLTQRVYNPIVIGDTLTAEIENGGDVIYYVFAPEESGLINFSSSANMVDAETYGILYNSSMNTLARSIGRSFNVRYYVEAGNTYYFTANYSDDSVVGSFNVTLAEWSDFEDIEIGDTKTAVIPTSGSQAFFRFVPAEDMRIRYYSTASVDTYGYIYDSRLNELTSNDDSGYDSNFLIQYNLTAGNTYYLGARFYGSSATGEFDVKLRQVVYTPIEPGDVLTAEIEDQSETAYFTFTPDRDMTVVFTGSANNYVYSVLYNSNMSSLSSSNSRRATIKYNLRADNKYYFSVRFDDDVTGSISVTLSELAYTDIAIGETKNVEITEPGDTKYFRFVPEEDMTVIYRSYSDEYVYGNIHDGDPLNYSSSMFDYYFYDIYDVYAGQTYYFSTGMDDYNATGSYSISLTKLEYTPVSIGDTLNVELPVQSDRAYYSFTPDEDMTLVIRANDNNYMEIAIRNGSTDRTNTISGSNIYYRYKVQAGVTYYLTARYNNYDATGSFDLSIAELGFEDIRPGDSRTAHIMESGEKAYYRFTPDFDMPIIFRGYSENYLLGCIYDENFNELASDEGDGFYLLYMAKAGNTYYLSAEYGYSDLTGNFEVSLETQDLLDLAIGDIARGSVTYNENIAIYSFTPAKNELLNYRVKGSGGDVYTTVVNYDLVSNISSGSGSDYSYDICCEAGKTYYFIIRTYGGTANYTLSLSRFANFTDIYPGETLPATIVSGQITYFRFIPTEDTTIRYYSVSGSDTYGYLYDWKLTGIYSDDDSGSGNNFYISYNVKKGETYYLGARYYGGGSGTFNIVLATDQYIPNGSLIRVRDRLFDVDADGEYTYEYRLNIGGKMTAVDASLRYDSANLELTGYEFPEFDEDDVTAIEKDGELCFNWLDANGVDFSADDTVLIRATFKVLNSSGVYSIRTVIKDMSAEDERRLVDNYMVNADFTAEELITDAEEYEPGIMGDVDGDGEITILDATRIQRYLVELCGIDGGSYDEQDPDSDKFHYADVDGDGRVTVVDALRIRRYLVGLCDLNGNLLQDVTIEF